MQFARSVETLAQPSGREVVEIVTSPITKALQETIEWVDTHVGQDAKAELISVPELLLTGLWLHGPEIDAVVVSSLANSFAQIEANKLIDSLEFIRRLRQQQPVQGLGPRSGFGPQLDGQAE